MCSLLSILVFLQRWLVSLVLRRTRHAGASCARRGRGPGAGTGQEACPTWSYRWMPRKMSTISWARPFTTSPMAFPAASDRKSTRLNFSHLVISYAVFCLKKMFKDPLVVKKGYMDVPDRPGFGMELIPDLEKNFFFFFYGYGDPRDLPSFPTRRSSD